MIVFGKTGLACVAALLQRAWNAKLGLLWLVAATGPWVNQAIASEDSQPAAVADREPTDSGLWSTLRYVPKDAYFVAGTRPRDLLNASELSDLDATLTALLEFGVGRRLDVHMLDVDQLVVVGAYGGVRLADYNAMAILELRTREAVNNLMRALFGSEFDSRGADANGAGSIAVVGNSAGAILDERTVLLGQPSVVQSWKFSGGSPKPVDITDRWRVQSATPSDTYAFALLDVERLRRFAPKFDDWMLSEHPWLAAGSPLLRQTRRAEVVVQAQHGLRLQTTVLTNEEALGDIEATLRAGTTILRNVLGELPPDLAVWSRETATPALSLARDVLRTPLVKADAESQSTQMTLAVSRDQIRQLRAVIEPLSRDLKVSAQRALRSRNLQKIGGAMLAYYGKHGQFPTSEMLGTENAQPHSWRVALLPFLGEQKLFERYRLDEPWDSSANQEVLRRMPDIYRHIDDSPTSYRSAYYGLTGPGTAFGDGREQVRLRDFRDGISNTIVVVESRQGVPWTKPSDIEVSSGGDVPSFGGFDPEGSLVLLGDTAVTFLPKTISQDHLRAFVTRAGGERISPP